MAENKKLDALRKRILSGGNLTDQEAYDLAKADGPGSLAAIEVLTRDPKVQGELESHWYDKGPGGEITPKKKFRKTPKTTGDGEKTGDGKTTGDGEKEGGKPTASKIPTPSSATSGAGMDFLRTDAQVHARELSAAKRGVGTSKIQRLFRAQRLKSNLNETMGKLEKDPETGQMVRTGGLTKFRRDEAARRKAEIARGDEAYDEAGNFLVKRLRDKEGKVIGSASSAKGREVLKDLYGTPQREDRDGDEAEQRVASGTSTRFGADPSKAPWTEQDVYDRQARRGRMAQTSKNVRDLLNRPQIMRRTGEQEEANEKAFLEGTGATVTGEVTGESTRERGDRLSKLGGGVYRDTSSGPNKLSEKETSDRYDKKLAAGKIKTVKQLQDEEERKRKFKG